METENSGLNVDKFFDEGVAEAGLEEEVAASEDQASQDDNSGVVAQVSEDKGATEKSKTEQAETKTDEKKEKTADSSAEDIQDALKETKEDESESDSVIESLLPKAEEIEAAAAESSGQPDRTGKTVPLADHIKLRERAQRAEHEAEELKAKIETTSTAGVKAGEVEKSPLEKFAEEHSDEDVVMAELPLKVQLAESKFQEKRQLARQDSERKEQQAITDAAAKQRQTRDSIKAINDRALKSETEFRKVTTDFDEVVLPIVNADLLKDSERLDFLKSEDPAKRLYEICKAKRDAIRSMTGTPKETPTDKPKKTKASTPTKDDEAAQEGELTDDEIFEEVRGLLPAGSEED